jgi:protein involved in polysaccharide export with SLBB domain
MVILLAAGRLAATDPPAAASPAPAAPATNRLLQAPADASVGTNALDDKYKMAIGDILSFQIVEDEEDPRSLTVMDSGDLQVPYIGRYAAVGKTCKELAGALKTELEKDYYKRATVIIAVNVKASRASKSPGKVYLVGAVHLVGPQELPSDEEITLSKAILRAGGFTDFADRRHVKVTRKQGAGEADNKVFTVNVQEILEKSKTDLDLPLEPGDLIFVPDKVIRF